MTNIAYHFLYVCYTPVKISITLDVITTTFYITLALLWKLFKSYDIQCKSLQTIYHCYEFSP